MMCIRCKNDCTYPQRSDGRCPKCKGEFAFEPRTGAFFSDRAFQRAIEHVSSGGQVRWGVENLYYQLCRTRRFGTILSFIVQFFGTDTNLVRLDNYQFTRMWERWLQVHGQPTGVIIRKGPPSNPQVAEPDIGDYSFDRVVVCDRARTVDILLANNFHFENNCAVLSIEGYPPGPFAIVRKMLQRNPKLQVFTLHDATPAGCTLAQKVAVDPEWFNGKIRIVDVGLRLCHAKPYRGLFLRAPGKTIRESNGVQSEEAKWLECYALELAVIRPEQILKRLFRAMNRQFNPQETTDTGSTWDGGGGVYIDYRSFSTNATAADGGADAFG